MPKERKVTSNVKSRNTLRSYWCGNPNTLGNNKVHTHCLLGGGRVRASSKSNRICERMWRDNSHGVYHAKDFALVLSKETELIGLGSTDWCDHEPRFCCGMG